jgi:hypothetical protein
MALKEYKLFKQLIKSSADSNDQSDLTSLLRFDIDSTFVNADDEDSIEVSLNGQQIVKHNGEPTETFAKYYYSYSILVPKCKGISLAVSGPSKTITRSSGSFLLDGFAVGQTIVTTGFTESANNGTFIISNISDNGLVITCSTATGLTTETTSAGIVTLDTTSANSDLYCTLSITINANQSFTAPGYAVGQHGLVNFIADDTFYISFYKTVTRDI